MGGGEKSAATAGLWAGATWSHRLVLPVVRRLVGTPVTPNHLTALRLATGLAACAALSMGTPDWSTWAGWLWIASLLLDYADGALARIGGMATPGGHLFDYVADLTVNALLFLAIGIGARNGIFGAAAFVMGTLASASVALSALAAETLERYLPSGEKTWSGAFGFAPEDLLYLIAPLAWLGWLEPFLVLAAIGAPVALAVIGGRLWKARRAVLLSSVSRQSGLRHALDDSVPGARPRSSIPR